MAICSLPAKRGDCLLSREMWYFDTRRGICDRFFYSGCGGNSNRFSTKHRCQARCQLSLLSKQNSTSLELLTSPDATVPSVRWEMTWADLLRDAPDNVGNDQLTRETSEEQTNEAGSIASSLIELEGVNEPFEPRIISESIPHPPNLAFRYTRLHFYNPLQPGFMSCARAMLIIQSRCKLPI
ncbi:unnamed protein product [Protopolystoma xenopodis]|uniref:BPTI/Kunitz inhibitor domain-containing protein n=1 Tax=Protopolystoma xenopodis TaxID=117903 RepID=A0A3S5ALQ7_9PLAT|nr:unnamed protein product [Protopolystoma xenopodis]